MQRGKVWGICLAVLGVLAAGLPLMAQGESESKPPMYVYVSEWAVPRAQWGEMAKLDDQERALEDKLLNDGTITAYGELVSLIHTEGQPTHADFFWAPSEGNILKALAGFYAQPGNTSPVLAGSKHWDHFLRSTIHNYRSGKFDGAYLAGSMWKLKPGQGHAFDAIVKSRIIPLLEKGLSEGTVIFYSVDSEDYHTEAPGLVDVVFAVTDAAAVDKVNDAFEAALGNDTEIGPALAALTERDSHRDFLDRITHLVVK
jgi:hypothetical protein